jgi:signal transduction histidine kinase
LSTELPAVDRREIRANKLDLLEALADDLAHEIKNPMHSMVINLEVLRRRAARHEPEEGDLVRYIGVVTRELERVNQTVDLLLSLLRPTRTGDAVTLNELMEGLQELVSFEATHREVDVRFEPASVPSRLRIPREPLRQAVLNVLLSTLDQLEKGASVVLSTGRAEGEAFITVRASSAAGPAPSGELSTANLGTSRVEIARSLVESLGGELRFLDTDSAVPEIALAFPVTEG